MHLHSRLGYMFWTDAGGTMEDAETVRRDVERILGQEERGEVRTGPEAARKIAKRVEDSGGFWGPRKAH